MCGVMEADRRFDGIVQRASEHLQSHVTWLTGALQGRREWGGGRGGPECHDVFRAAGDTL